MCTSRFEQLNNIYDNLRAQNHPVELIGIGKTTQLDYSENWTSGNDAPVCADPSPFSIWDQWGSSQRDLFVLDLDGNVVLQQNITNGLPQNLDSLVISLLNGEIIFEPVIADIDDQEMIEDSTIVVTISASSSSGSDLSFHVESDADSSAFSELFITQPPSTNNWVGLRITPQENWFGTANITIIVADENNLSDTTDFNITVVPVNDRPEDFTLFYPTIEDTFSTHPESNTTIVFSWEESFDVDSDVTYTLIIELEFSGNTYTDIHENIIDTSISISSNSLDPMLNITSQDNAIFAYTVDVSDEEFSMTASERGMFVLSRAYLSTINKDVVPEVFALHQNYPNPFNPTTTLKYDLPEDALVNITIYDMMGRQVSTLVSSQQNAGFKSVRWNSTNDKGQPISAGLYLYTIQTGEFRQTKKMVLLK